MRSSSRVARFMEIACIARLVADPSNTWSSRSVTKRRRTCASPTAARKTCGRVFVAAHQPFRVHDLQQLQDGRVADPVAVQELRLHLVDG